MPLGKRVEPMFVKSSANKNETENNDTAVKSEMFQSEEPQYSFSDIIMNIGTFDAIQDVLALYSKRELLFDDWGLGETHKRHDGVGINLYGHSGTGKSMAAHAIARQVGRNILTVDYSQIESKYVGETSKNLTAMFKYAKETNSIIFFDKAYALLSRRVTNMSNSTDVSVNQTRSVLLILGRVDTIRNVRVAGRFFGSSRRFSAGILAYSKENQRRNAENMSVRRALSGSVNTP